jgi:hypothetical protein
MHKKLTLTVGVALLLFVGAWITSFILQTRDAKAYGKRKRVAMSDVSSVAEKLKELEKSKDKIELSDLQQRVTLLSGARWEDIRIYPFAPDDSPLVEYRGPILESSHLVCYRSGGILVVGNEKPMVVPP